ncbi:Cell division protein FtsQ [Minicystis rosea]|nr:Cell division protein FtsQ [Minicystis rosea]
MSAPPTNRRRPLFEGPAGNVKRKVIDAPRDPGADDDSPLPGPATTTVRPPAPPKSEKPKGKGGSALRMLQMVGGAAIVLAASIGVAYGARRYITSSPRFAVRTVLVDGVHRRTATQVANGGGVAVGKNIFALDLKQAGALITQDPWIEKATVVRKLPSTISITVVEREAAALVSIGSELYLATRDGDLFKKIGQEDPSDLPIITGIPTTQVTSDRPGVVIAVRRALDVADEADRTGISKRYPLQELHLEKDGSLVVTIGREAIALSLGRPPYRDKMEEASRILNELARRKANASVIFLDNDAHPERVVVRMR